MNIVISAHLDTIFTVHAMMRISNGIAAGATDNSAGRLAVAPRFV